MLKCINSAVSADRYFPQSLLQFPMAWQLPELCAAVGEEPQLLPAHPFWLAWSVARLIPRSQGQGCTASLRRAVALRSASPWKLGSVAELLPLLFSRYSKSRTAFSWVWQCPLDSTTLSAMGQQWCSELIPKYFFFWKKVWGFRIILVQFTSAC